MAAIVSKVFPMREIPEVAELAKGKPQPVGCKNIEVIVGDGTIRYLQKPPYDGIIITAATPSVPKPLIDQLAEGGRLVTPLADAICRNS